MAAHECRPQPSRGTVLPLLRVRSSYLEHCFGAGIDHGLAGLLHLVHPTTHDDRLRSIALQRDSRWVGTGCTSRERRNNNKRVLNSRRVVRNYSLSSSFLPSSLLVRTTRKKTRAAQSTTRTTTWGRSTRRSSRVKAQRIWLPRTLGGSVPRGPRCHRKRRASRPPGSFAETDARGLAHLVSTSSQRQDRIRRKELFRPERRSTIVAASPQDPLVRR